ncbi:MAG: peptidase M23 [Firmicutes bacterium]|nr:peptidase M23 [Bacillota bacterium]
MVKGFKFNKFHILICLILILNSIVVYADGNDVNDLQQELNENKDKMEELNNDIKNNKKKANKVEKTIEQYDQKIESIDSQLRSYEAKINNLLDNIEITKAKLTQAKESINEKNDTLNSRLRVMYINGPIGYAEVLLGAEDLGDFLTRLDMVKSLVDHDVELLKYMNDQREKIETNKKELENKKIILASTKEKIEEKKNNLEVVTRQKEREMTRLKQNTKELERQYDKLYKEANALEDKIKRMESAGKYTGGRMAWPVPAYRKVTSPYGYRIHPVFKTKKFHTGIDLRAYYGTTIVAANGGVVKISGWLGGYGKVVLIDHGGGISTLYAHNSRLLVKEGQRVTRGQAISKAGSTGYSTASHLHFEVRDKGKYENPLPWITKQ